jgi:hypothetical protein
MTHARIATKGSGAAVTRRVLMQLEVEAPGADIERASLRGLARAVSTYQTARIKRVSDALEDAAAALRAGYCKT